MAAFFLDTGFIIALVAADDQNHHRALTHWPGLLITKPKLINTLPRPVL